MTTTTTDNGTTAARDAAFRRTETAALDTPPAIKQPVVRVEAREDGPLAACANVQDLLRRADRSDDRRIRTVAARIRHDVDLLEQLLANTAEVKAARRRVESLQKRRNALNEQLAEAEALLAATRQGAPSGPGDGVVTARGPEAAPSDALAYSQDVRTWLRRNGYPVAIQGRLKREHLQAYRDAHPGAAADV